MTETIITTETTITNISIDLIDPDPGQPRTEKNGADFDDYIESLGESIAAEGLNNPIHVRVHPGDPGRYMLVNGECRWRAHLANKQLRTAGTIPAIIKEFASDGDVYINQIVDNESRRNLGPMEQVRAYGTAIDRGATIDEIAAKLGKNASAIKKDIALLNLPRKVQDAVEAGDCSKKLAHFILKTFPPDEDAAHDKQAAAWLKASSAKNYKDAEAKVLVYRADKNKQDIPGMEVTEEDKAAAGDFKKGRKHAEKLKKFLETHANSPYSNGSGIVMVRAYCKHYSQVAGLTELEGMAKEMEAAGKKLRDDLALYRAQSNLTSDGQPARTGTNG